MMQSIIASRVPVPIRSWVSSSIDNGLVQRRCFSNLIELKWFAESLEPKHIGSFYFKVDGKLGARGVAIAMNGYVSGVVESVAKGKELKVLLLDGMHLSNVIYGHYTFPELRDHTVKCASLSVSSVL